MKSRRSRRKQRWLRRSPTRALLPPWSSGLSSTSAARWEDPALALLAAADLMLAVPPQLPQAAMLLRLSRLPTLLVELRRQDVPPPLWQPMRPEWRGIKTLRLVA